MQTPYLAVYRQSGDVIEILRVLHQSQAWSPRESSE
ncbi:type II toxin-antitoxin system RelE/ParE family toxin [Salinisphaera sp. RV14]